MAAALACLSLAQPRSSSAGEPPVFGAPVALGELVPDSGFDHMYSNVAPLASGGGVLLLVWQDRVGDDILMLARRFTPGGEPLDGSPITLSDGPMWSLVAPRIAYDGTRFLAVWQDYVTGASGDYFKVVGRRIEVDGSLPEAAPFPIVDVDTGVAVDPAPDVAGVAGVFLVAWEDPRRMIPDHADLYAAIVDGDTGVVNPADGFVLAETDVNLRSVEVASDGVDFLAVWEQEETVDEDDEEDIVAASVSASGGIVSSPFTVCGIPSSQSRSPHVAGGQGSYFVVWEDEQGIYSYAADARGTIVDGSSLSVLTPDGAPVLDDGGGIAEPVAVTAVGSDFAVLLSRPGCLPPFDDILVLGIDGSDGTAMTADPISAWNLNSALARDVAAVSDDAVVVLGRRSYPPGHPTRQQAILSRVDLDAGVSLDPAGLNLNSGYNHQNTVDAAMGENHALVAWSDSLGIAGGTSTDIYAMRTSRDGDVLIKVDAAPFLVSDHPAEEGDPAVASTGGRFLIVWRELSDPIFGDKCSYSIRAARVDEETGDLLDPVPLTIAEASSGREAPVVEGIDGRFLVAWAGPGEDGIFGAMVEADTGVVDDFGGVPIFDTDSGEMLAMSTGTDAFWLVWTDWRNAYEYPVWGWPFFNWDETRCVHLYGGWVIASTGGVPEPDGVQLITHGVNNESPQLIGGLDGQWLWWEEFEDGFLGFPEVTSRSSATTPADALLEAPSQPVTSWSPLRKRALATNGAEYLSLWSSDTDVWHAARHLGADGSQLDDPPLDAPIPTGLSRWGQYVIAGDPGGYSLFWIGPSEAEETYRLFGLAVSLPECVIGGEGFWSGAAETPGGCLRCVPAMDATAWTPLPEGTPCDDGDDSTTSDFCTAYGHCIGTSIALDAGPADTDTETDTETDTDTEDQDSETTGADTDTETQTSGPGDSWGDPGDDTIQGMSWSCGCAATDHSNARWLGSILALIAVAF